MCKLKRKILRKKRGNFTVNLNIQIGQLNRLWWTYKVIIDIHCQLNTLWIMNGGARGTRAESYEFKCKQEFLN